MRAAERFDALRHNAQHLVDEAILAATDRPRFAGAVAAGTLIVVVAVTMIFLSVTRTSPIVPADQITFDRVTAAASRIPDDLDAGIVTVDDDMVRRFETSTVDGLVGTIAQRSPTGTCIGFEVTVPTEWLIDGSGEVEAGAVGVAPSLWCEPRAVTGPDLGEQPADG